MFNVGGGGGGTIFKTFSFTREIKQPLAIISNVVFSGIFRATKVEMELQG